MPKGIRLKPEQIVAKLQEIMIDLALVTRGPLAVWTQLFMGTIK